jgi:hypothetical protein
MTVGRWVWRMAQTLVRSALRTAETWASSTVPTWVDRSVGWKGPTQAALRAGSSAVQMAAAWAGLKAERTGMTMALQKG